MVAYFTDQLVNVVLIMALFVSSFRSKMIKEGTELLRIKQTAMNHALFSEKDRDVCFCNFFNRVWCRHCPRELYCNTQQSGCCPDRDSENKCHNFCVPPRYTCCKNNGACGNMHPTCCEHYCCGRNEKCCGKKKCCMEETKPCKNDEQVKFHISNSASLQVDISPEYSRKQIHDSEAKYFSTICEVFAKATRLENNSDRLQFAVLTLNELSSEENSANKYRPLPIKFNIEKQKGNYVSASPKKIRIKKNNRYIYIIEHAEIRILKVIEDKINSLNGQPNPPNIYLFTLLSPCKRCVDEIILTKTKIKGSRMFIGWQLTYNKINQEDFFEGIRKMMHAKITIVYLYSPDKLCEKEFEGPLLFQQSLLNEFVDNYDYTDVDFCESEKDLRSSFIKLINWLVWNCIKKFELDSDTESRDNVIDCMTDKIKNIKPKINPCINLSKTIKVSIKKLFIKNPMLLLSPPLDPETKTTSISNRLTDLIADYKSPYLCFQVE